MATTTDQSDLQEVLLAAFERRPVDPEVSKRVRERAEKVKEEIRQRGLTDVAVSLIREGRDE